MGHVGPRDDPFSKRDGVFRKDRYVLHIEREIPRESELKLSFAVRPPEMSTSFGEISIYIH